MSVEIIAEIGINFGGNLDLAHNMIREAAISGADIAKFQLYSVDALFGTSGEDPNEEIYKGVRHTELKREDVAKLIGWCFEEGIEFMASVFDEERFGWLEEFGVRRHKIASRTSKLTRGLAEKIAQTGKPCLMSLGFNSKPLDLNKYENVKYLWCVSEYPTEYSKINLPQTFKDDIFSGFSDHSLGIEASLVAIGRGAKVIEKHVTYDKSCENPKFDHVCSIDFLELKELVKYARLMDKVVKYCE